MATTKDRALRAAVEEVGAHGIRALTHARVDARAGLPKGSTSNWFRTRAALVAGVVAHLADEERAMSPDAEVATVDDLVDVVCVMVERASGPEAARTRVRLALSLEAAHSPDLRRPLREQRDLFVAWAAELLAQVGAQHPLEAARMLLACANGLLFHRLTVEPDVEIRPVIERCVRACTGEH
ncbi:TetR family transcriptional regulator [Nocardioides KLBMP 9356]|uniref:TetR family transcriptional regulator n=1 Tax=Nocardioides potassii TaxID=2911371 RepID=A0ABS9HBK0_9ACTN|nr:TetR/AcrR family transcriptional regulator [Nocardioides potassii]MCF6378572.1 TetR family transcriptional regulator [Nocardioides potassii]